MEMFFEFVKENYTMLLSLVLNIVVLFVAIFKKKVKVHDTFEVVLMALPGLIREAESRSNTGSEKYSYVFNRCVELLQCLTHQKTEDLLVTYTPLINSSIESILSTPQKKER